MKSAASGALEVWSVDLDALSRDLQQADDRLRLLSSSERAWPVEPPDTRRWRRLGRIALRLVLDIAGAPDARGTELDAEAHGKPRLASGAVAFNVSHSEALALIAVCRRGPLGIDLERDRNVALGERRRQMIVAAAAGLCPASPPSGFLQAWTYLEAFGKAGGIGIGALLSDLGITANGTKTLRDEDVVARATHVSSTSGLLLAPLKMPAGLYAALAGPAGVADGAADPRQMTAADCALT